MGRWYKHGVFPFMNTVQILLDVPVSPTCNPPPLDVLIPLANGALPGVCAVWRQGDFP